MPNRSRLKRNSTAGRPVPSESRSPRSGGGIARRWAAAAAAATGAATARAGPSAGSAKRSTRAIAALSSRRSTTRSSMPCSSRNSLRWNPSGSFCRMVCSMTRGPAKPMSALGSAMLTSPSIAKLAVTPPVVGSVRTEM